MEVSARVATANAATRHARETLVYHRAIAKRSRSGVEQTLPSSSDNPAHTARRTRIGVPAAVASTFGWLMCTLATGAIAAFVSLVTGVRPSWLVLLLALPLTLVLRLSGCLYARWAPPLAAGAVLLAGAYAASLAAVARIASATGFPFGQAFRTGGLALTLQVARLGLDVASVLVYAVAAVLAAALASRLTRRATSGR